MFGLSIPAFLLNNWKAILGGVVILGLLIAFKVADARAHHWHKAYDQRTVELNTFTDRVNAATAKFRAAGLERLVLDQKARLDVDKGEINALRTDRDSLFARYNRMRASAKDTSGGPVEPVPGFSIPSGGFATDASHPGFWTIRASDAITILEACDGYRQSFLHLLSWADKQASIKVELPPPDDRVTP